ncbi:acyltransferase [Paraburkholderia sp. FT54]|uniref:acyltransferase family protein n=1 Tax=Paraburkholderia sp. FT54 TaxID=3074437 RepID=UPI0028780013|nr:acyltransferase [Paraburkholderia sp. FT54]WNC89263.1 acyltransferase [Paraburkholderia sp. FT54]
MIFHYAPDSIARNLGIDWGTYGVHIFFVLSGFVITKSIVENSTSENHPFRYLGEFWIARMFRLIPLAYVAIFMVYFLSKIPLDNHFLYYNLLFSANFYTALTGKFFPYLLHFWTLGVEMQFYIIYPIILLLTRKNIPWALCLSFIVACATRILLVWNVAYVHPGSLLPWNADTFVLGGLLFWASSKAYFKSVVYSLIFIGLAIFINSVVARITDQHTSGLHPSLNDLFVAGLIGTLVFKNSVSNRIFSHRILVHLGKISYGIYVWHFSVLVLWDYLRDNYGHLYYGILSYVPLWVILTITTVAFAEASWYMFERRLNQLGRRIAASIRPARQCATASVSAGVHSASSGTATSGSIG